MALETLAALQFANSAGLNFLAKPIVSFPKQSTNSIRTPMCIEVRARANARIEKPRTFNRRMHKKFNGTARKPRLSVFCSEKQLYAMLVDDQNKKYLFYANTLQKSIRQVPPCTTIEAAQRVGEALVKACENLNINEISSYDRNGFGRGKRMEAFEISIAHHGFLPR